MKNVPHWQWLIALYLFMVAVPVFYVHAILKRRALTHRTFANLLLYFVGVIGTGFLLHNIAMYIYFTFFFTVRA
jgi:DNA-binding transcriptional regulator of glucitol operon